VNYYFYLARVHLIDQKVMVKTSTCGEKVSVFHKYIKQHKQF